MDYFNFYGKPICRVSNQEKMEKITAFKTSDGKIFEKASDAAKHEQKENIIGGLSNFFFKHLADNGAVQVITCIKSNWIEFSQVITEGND